MVDSKKLNDLLTNNWLGLDAAARDKICEFYNLVYKENQIQNLTKLINISDFFEGHVIDVRELLKSCLINYPALDLGSGLGVPGLMAAAVEQKTWIISEAEKRKADFLIRAVRKLNIQGHITVFSGRAEDFLINNKVQSVVVRAVGPIDRIYRLIRRCSTWNNLILFKGPAWEREWLGFNKSHFCKELILTSTHEYFIGSDKKYRIIAKLNRVPRGTKSINKTSIFCQ
ncbi:MAG: RsmG family class I SAM-dependent methyltransferase [Candidatus Poribacteria bacterium]